MAVTKMWPVKASLAAPLDYITQETKTVQQVEIPDGYSQTDKMSLRDIMDFYGQDEERKDLENVLGYVAQGIKTDEEKFVTGVNCMEVTARQEMEQVKKQWRKEGGNVCIHCYQSFAPGEITPELAHTVGVELAKSLWGGRFQVVVATHLDREHIHNHFVINTVSFVDGKRFHYGQEAYDLMRITSDKLCREYGLSVIDRPNRGRQPNPTAYDKAGIERTPPYHSLIKQDIDDAIQQSRDMQDFYRILRKKGYTFRPGNVKYFSLKPPGKERFTRIEKWYGSDYSLDGIARRITEQQVWQLSSAENKATVVLQEDPAYGQSREETPAWPSGQAWDLRQDGEPSGTPKATVARKSPQLPIRSKKRYRGSFRKDRQRHKGGFQGLYLYYCYLFGIFPKRKQYSYVSRNELHKMRNISKETRLLLSNHIDTMEQLGAYRAEKQSEIIRLCAQRKPLYNRLRSADPAEQAVLQSQIDTLTAQIRQEREQVKLCDDIQRRAVREAQFQTHTGSIGNQNQEVKEPQSNFDCNTENKDEKEENEYGYDTGRGQRSSQPDHDASCRRNPYDVDLDW